MKDNFNFNQWIESAMLKVTKKALLTIEKLQTTEQHCFYVTFITSNPKVKIPKFLYEQYPDEITIVLEHQFTDFKFINNGFSVNLFFKGQKCEIFCPLNAIINFYDKTTNLHFTFKHNNLITKDIIKTIKKPTEIASKTPATSSSVKIAKPDNNIIPFKP